MNVLHQAAASRPAAGCDAVIAFAEEIVALPPHVAGQLVRFMASRWATRV